MGVVEDQQMKASSVSKTNTPHKGRLAGPSAWCSQEAQNYLKIELKILHIICAVATQGLFGQGYFTKQYLLLLGTGNLTDLYKVADNDKVICLVICV